MGRKLIPYLLLFFLVLSILPLTVNTQEAEQEQEITFGNPTSTFINWTRFWKLFNTYSEWDLEYNNGSGWISDKSQLQIIKNYTERTLMKNGTFEYIPSDKINADSCKITLNFTASYTADYRLTFAINLDVKNYTHKESSWNYTISYKNHTVFFDWSDIKNLPLDNVAHGIQPVGDDSYFWFRIRKNNVSLGKNIIIDPIFGNNVIGGTTRTPGGADYKVICKFTAPEAGTLTKLTMYLDRSSNGANNACRAIIYSDNAGAPNNLLDSGSDVVMTDTWAWQDLSGLSYVFANGEILWIGVHSNQNFNYKQDAGDANQEDRVAGDEFTDGTGTPWGDTHNYQAWNVSVYATYTAISGQDLTFNLFENFLLWGSFTRSLVLSRSTYENIQILSSSSRGIEVGRNLFENLRIYGTVIELIEVTVLDLYFSLFENVQVYSSALIGRELALSFFENRRIWASTSTVFEGIAIDLSFTLFETVRVWTGLAEIIVSPYTVNDALLLAGFAVILAFVAIGLVFLVRKES